MDPRRFLLTLAAAACSSPAAAGDADTAALDTAALEISSADASAPVADGSADAADAPAPPSLRPCPTSGKGAVTGDVCHLLTPAESGLPAAGVNANVDQYALRPTSGARGRLLVFFNGSGGSPVAGTRGSPAQNYYATARAAGLHVFALSYRSDDAIGSLCKGNDACLLPTRRTILSGIYQAGASPALSTVAEHEGAYARLAAGLKALAERDPAGGWDAFLEPAGAKPGDQIRWAKVIASGHSQGGGHAAAIAMAFEVDRLVALSSPCDQTASGPATWLDAAKYAYATSPAAKFHGLGAAGDAICAGYPAIWKALGMAQERSHANAVVCTGSTPHGASIDCVENAPKWSQMLQ